LTAEVAVKQMLGRWSDDHRGAVIAYAKQRPNVCKLLVTRQRRTLFVGREVL
jgi:hypothetical protein